MFHEIQDEALRKKDERIKEFQEENEDLRTVIAEIRDRETQDGDSKIKLRREIKRLRKCNIKAAQWDCQREELVLKLKAIIRGTDNAA